MDERLAQQRAVAAGHLGELTGLPGLLRREPGEVERVVLGGAVTADGHDVDHRDGVLARVVASRRPDLVSGIITLANLREALLLCMLELRGRASAGAGGRKPR